MAGEGAAETVATVAQSALGFAGGTTVGPVSHRPRVGHGGMGVVYLAERADAAFEKRVAIKVVRAGFSTRRRAPLSRRAPDPRDAGASEHRAPARRRHHEPTALPYFVMEYVDGVPVDAYCDDVPPAVAGAAAAVPTDLRRRAVRASAAW